MATYSKVLKVESNFRDAFPWIYRLNCGHSFYGQKSKTTRNGDYPQHPQKMICKACNNADNLNPAQLYELGWHNTPKEEAVSEQLPNGLHHTVIHGDRQRIPGNPMQIPRDHRIKHLVNASQVAPANAEILRVTVAHRDGFGAGFNLHTFNGALAALVDLLKKEAKRKYDQKVFLGSCRIRIYAAGPDQWLWTRHNIPASVRRENGWTYRETIDVHPLAKGNRDPKVVAALVKEVASNIEAAMQ